MSDLIDLRDRIRSFAAERDWKQFHDPKSLLLALVGEVGELAEIFQWLPADRAQDLAQQGSEADAVRDELADVLIYLVQLADSVGVDLHEAAVAKMAKNAMKYPAP